MSGNSRFFQNINYASFHEDGDSEREALALNGSDRVLCLTGSGARPLDLLLDGPSEIVAIDWNPAQSHLLELKIAVIRRLEYDEGLAFLGLLPSTLRESTYATIRGELSEEAQAFWDRRRATIRRGVFFEGRWERFLRRISWVARRTRRSLVDRVLGADDLVHQRSIWNEQWDNRSWRMFLRCVTNRSFLKYVLREPGLNYVPGDISISNYLRRRFEQASGSILFRESPWIWALFKGRIEVGGPLPAHLKPENFDTLRDRLDTLTVVTASLRDYLQDGDSRFDAFSLSDFLSYADKATYYKIWAALLRRAAVDARICERQFLVRYPLPTGVQSALTIDESLGEELDRRDRSVVYTFLVARVPATERTESSGTDK